MCSGVCSDGTASVVVLDAAADAAVWFAGMAMSSAGLRSIAMRPEQELSEKVPGTGPRSWRTGEDWPRAPRGTGSRLRLVVATLSSRWV